MNRLWPQCLRMLLRKIADGAGGVAGRHYCWLMQTAAGGTANGESGQRVGTTINAEERSDALPVPANAQLVHVTSGVGGAPAKQSP